MVFIVSGCTSLNNNGFVNLNNSSGNYRSIIVSIPWQNLGERAQFEQSICESMASRIYCSTLITLIPPTDDVNEETMSLAIDESIADAVLTIEPLKVEPFDAGVKKTVLRAYLVDIVTQKKVYISESSIKGDDVISLENMINLFADDLVSDLIEKGIIETT